MTDAFEQALEAVFEERAADFSPGLREMLRQLWREGVLEGRALERTCGVAQDWLQREKAPAGKAERLLVTATSSAARYDEVQLAKLMKKGTFEEGLAKLAEERTRQVGPPDLGGPWESIESLRPFVEQIRKDNDRVAACSPGC